MDRFWKKVEKSEECWVWTAVRTNDGYGRFYLDGKMRLAHRVSYEFAVGPIPDGLEIDHLCRNRSCVRPDHLEAVTHKENARRGDIGGHAQRATTHCPAGHEYTEENTYKYKNKRQCRKCKREWDRKSRNRQR